MGTGGRDTRSIEELRRANAELQRQLDERTAELHEKNERYALVSDAVAEGVYDWNIERNTLFVSPRLMEMFGFEGLGLRSEAWFALVHAADRAAYREALRDCFKGRTAKVGCEYRILLQSGEYRWVEDHGLPIRDAAGRAVRLVGAVSDVTERKRADETLHDTARLNEALLGDLNAVIDTIDYGVLFMGPDLRARVINRAFRRMWGIPDAFIATRPTMADLINFNRHTGLYGVPEAEFDAFIARRIEAIRAGNIDPVELRRGDGKILRYQGVVLPDGGRLLTYLDITESKRREAELGEALEQQTATAEVLGVINSSPGDLAPVFGAILDKAHRLCGATQGTLQLYDGTHFHAVATHGLRPDWAEAQFHPRPPTNEADHELLRGARLVHYPDLAAVAAQYPADARMRSAVASGVRTILRVPLRREGTLLGYISAYREEVKPFSEQEIALLESFAQQAVIAMENARLITETREALEQQTATADVLQVINSSPGDLAPVFDALLEKATGLCNAAFGILSLYQGDDRHRVVSMRGVPEPVAALLKEPVRLGPETGMGRLVRGERIVHIVDAADDDAYRQGNPVRRALVDIAGTRTYLAVPLRRDDRLLGAFTIYRREVRSFTAKQIALAENFAAQAVIAMENVRLITETREALEFQSATSDVLKVISRSTFDLAPVLEYVIETAIRLCRAHMGSIFRLEDGAYRWAVGQGLDPVYREVEMRTPILPGPGTLVGRVALEGRTVHIADAQADPLYAAKDEARLTSATTMLGVPLLREETPIGVIAMARDHIEPFSESEIALVTTFADQAVIAIENVRLLTETRQRTVELQESLEYQTATSDVLKVISRSTFDLQPVLDNLVETAARLFGAGFTFIASRDGKRYRPTALYSVSPEWDAVLRTRSFVPDRGTILGRALLEARVVQVADIAADPEHSHSDAVTLGKARTVVGAPLLREGEAIGVMVLARQHVEPFTERQIDLIRTFADQAVIAIENTRLITETREALEQQTATAEVLGVINSSPGDLAPVFDAMLEKALDLCGAAFGELVTYDGEVFRVTALRGVSAEHAEFRLSHPAAPTPGTVTGQFVDGADVIHNEDLMATEAYERGDPHRRSLVDVGGARTNLAVALRKDRTLLGFIMIYRREVRPFTDTQIALLQNFAAQAVIAMENARLITETREALEQQTATAEVLGVINSSPGDLAPVFDAMLDKAMRLCGAVFGVMFTYDGEYFHLAADRGYPRGWELLEMGRDGPQPGPDTGFGRIARGERLVHIVDITDTDAYRNGDPIRRATADVLGARTCIFVALVKDDVLLGGMLAYRQEVRPFTDKQIALLQNFAAQAVIAMENARLITETREALEQQTATAEVLQVINSSPGDLAPVFDAMLDKALRLCGAAFGVLGTYDGERFRSAAARGVPPPYAKFREGDTGLYGPGTGPARLLAGEKSVHIPDLLASEPYLRGDPNRRALVDLGGARASLIVPLLNDRGVAGYIMIYRKETGRFSDKQIALLQNFAAQAVIAIENVRLFNELNARTHDLQEALSYQIATGEVLRIVASSPDRLAPVLDAILERATELCGVKAGNLYLHEDGVFRAVAARHPDPKMVANMLGEPRRPGPGTAIHRAFTTRIPVHIPDIADDDAYGAGNPFRVRMVERGVRAVLIVPLVRGDEAIGAVTIYRPAPEPYTEAQIELVRTFADQAVVAIENARLFGELREARDAAEAAYRDLQTAQSSLVQVQKMAALGQLTAGIAHEIKNPLNFVNNFAGLSTELLDELKEDLAPALAALDGGKRAALDETIAMLTGNLDKIAEHGRRADNIVKSMLEHSRGVSGEKRVVDLNALIDEALNLAFHGARAQDQSFNITLERDYAEALAPVELAPQEMTRVFLNLFGNGFYAAHKRAQANGGGAYRPTLRVATRDSGNTVEIAIRDNGTGIPADIRDKLFQPFFTTKPTGEGTGLGLSISYDIVTQQHGGTIEIASEEGAYTKFTIRLPRG